MSKRVFFSFHYQDVIDFRANVVRQHWVTKDDREAAGYFDASLWESAKLYGDENVKGLIDDGLKGTSATVVLIGSDTYVRRWVRYEILKSIGKGNRLFGVHINSIPGKDRQTKAQGPNPFEFLGVQFSTDGRSVVLFEWNGAKWIRYGDLTGWSFDEPRSEAVRGNFYKLGTWYRAYDWNGDNGYVNFATWVDES